MTQLSRVMRSFTLLFLVIVPQVFSKGFNELDDKIVGGHKADIENYPYQVACIFKKNFCGGFIVSKHYILTAGHCAENVPLSKIEVRGGSSFEDDGTIIPIAELKIHPKFRKGAPLNNDIACMKTMKPMEFSDTMMPIKIAHKNRLLKGKISVAGWGLIQDNGDVPDRMMHIELPVVPNEKCKRTYGPEFTNNMWCAGDYEKGGIGVCQGDSGGAAVQNDMAVGIVSYTGKCAGVRQPSVFANIAAPDIRDFITEYTGL